jgi:hypothetical protein
MDKAQSQITLPFRTKVNTFLGRMLNEGFEDISAADK